jgi:hypothetical protein
MGTITVGKENSTPIELYHEDHGRGPAVVLLTHRTFCPRPTTWWHKVAQR